MTDEDIYAFHPVPPPDAGPQLPPPRKRRLWPWVLGAAVLLAVVLAASCAAALLALAEAGRQGLNVTINGEPWQGGDLSAAHGALALLGVGAAALVVLLVVPLVVVLAVVLSPLWLLGLLLWSLLRRRPAQPARMSA